MPAPLSIVIPTLNAGAALPGALACLGEGLAAGLIRELVVSDGGSEDATQAIAEAAGAAWIDGAQARGRGPQIAAGVALARGEWVLLLHADTHLAPGWSDAVWAHLQAHPEQAGYFRLAFRASGLLPRLVAGWANLRSGLFGLPYGDQALLIRSEVLAAVGGIPELPLMEDVALARALRGRLRALPALALTSAERYQAEGWLRRGARNLWLLAQFKLGADPERLARRYYSGKKR